MTRKETTDAFNSLFLDARKEYLEALKAESKTQYDKFIKDLGKHCIKLVRKMRRQISGQYDGKSASRLRAKPSGGLYSAFPYVPMNNVIITSLCKVCYRGNVKSRLNVKSCGMSFVNSEKSTEFRYIFSQHAPKWQPFSQEIPLKRQIPAVCPLRQVIDK